jgi:hypothetical protein
MAIKFPSALDSLIGNSNEAKQENRIKVTKRLPIICASCMDDIVLNTVELFKAFHAASLKGRS